MPAKDASVNYDPASYTVASGASDARMTEHASGEDFGSQTGQAIQKLGATGEQIGTEASNIAVQRQGMINETLATNADVSFQADLGKQYGEFSSKSGLEATQALPQLQAGLEASRQKIRASLPGGADRAFDMLSARSMGYRLTSANEYAAQQLKAAQKDAGVNLVNASAVAAADPTVAVNDAHFGGVIGDIKHGVGMQMDPDHVDQNGNWKTDEAKSAYNQGVETAVGQAWKNRFDTLSNAVGPINAQLKFHDEQENIPPIAKAQIEAALGPQVFNAHTGIATSNTIHDAKQDHNDQFLNPQKPDIADAIHKFGEGGGLTSTTSVDGAVGGWQITPATWQTYAKPGEKIDDPKDNETVGRRIVSDLKSRFGDDNERIAVGYFSGPGNVSPKGSAAPWINNLKDGNGKSVSSYVNDVITGIGKQNPSKSYATNPNGSPITLPDYYMTHRADVISNGDQYAETIMPGNMEFRNAVRSRLTQQMDAAIQDQKGQYKQDNDFIMRAFNGDFSQGKHPTSMDDLEAIPNVKQVLDRSSVHSPDFVRMLDQRLLSASARGENKDMKEWGPKVWDVFKGIHAPAGDPNKITDVKQIYAMADGNGLTLGGIEKMAKEFNDANPTIPKGEDGELRKQAFKAAHTLVSGKYDFPGVPPDPEAESTWGHAMALMYKAEADGKAKGIPDSELYDPENKNWIGNVAKPLAKTLDQRMDAINAKISGKPAVVLPPLTDRVVGQSYKTPNGDFLWTGKGWRAPPSVPLPSQ